MAANLPKFADVVTSTKPLTWKALAKIMDNALLPAFKMLQQRCEALEKRVAELEARPSFKYCGTWEAGQTYKTGEFVTWGGSMWHCHVAHSTGREPGKSDYWKLSVMRGREGRRA